jgi:hypothetical protein
MQVVKIIVLIVLGAIGFLSLIIGAAAPLYRDSFEAKRERFLREGTPVTEAVIARVIGRKGKFLVCAPAGTPLPAAGMHPEGRWVRVSPTTYEQYRLNDPIELLVIGDETFVRDSEFYTVLQPTEATIIFALTGVAFVLVKKLWKFEPADAAAIPGSI